MAGVSDSTWTPKRNEWSFPATVTVRLDTSTSEEEARRIAAKLELGLKPGIVVVGDPAVVKGVTVSLDDAES